MNVQSGIAADAPALERHLARADISDDLDAYGAAILPALLTPDQCQSMLDLLADPLLPPTPRIAEPGVLGTGTYRFFNAPLPDAIVALRSALYAHLAPIANAWNEQMGFPQRYPAVQTEFLHMCRNARQSRSASTVLEHAAGQLSFLHQDLHGDLIFPLQAMILLSQPGRDFAGGELVITEQRPRMQTRPEVISLKQGDAAVLAVSNRPVSGSRGTYRVLLRHGFSKVRKGRQCVLSILFHDAA